MAAGAGAAAAAGSEAMVMRRAMLWLLLLGLAGIGCRCPATCLAGEPAAEQTLAERRARLVAELRRQGIEDERVLAAIGAVPRHRFVPEGLRNSAYANRPLPIGHEQTISQPYIVAFMTESLDLDGDEKVLEIGTGSGYQAAVLAECAEQVYSIEIVAPLAARAEKVLRSLGHDDIRLRVGDGFDGWPEAAPFDAIIVTAAPEQVPPPLVAQLAEGGRLSIPVGRDGRQVLRVYTKRDGELVQLERLAVRFVPMTGKAEQR